MLGQWKNPPDIGIEGACSTSLLKRDKNQHDIFINLEDPIQIAVQSSKGVDLTPSYFNGSE